MNPLSVKSMENSTHRLIQRARIILLADQGLTNTVISQKANLHRHQVRKRATTMADR